MEDFWTEYHEHVNNLLDLSHGIITNQEADLEEEAFSFHLTTVGCSPFFQTRPPSLLLHLSSASHKNNKNKLSHDHSHSTIASVDVIKTPCSDFSLEATDTANQHAEVPSFHRSKEQGTASSHPHTETVRLRKETET